MFREGCQARGVRVGGREAWEGKGASQGTGQLMLGQSTDEKGTKKKKGGPREGEQLG